MVGGICTIWEDISAHRYSIDHNRNLFPMEQHDIIIRPPQKLTCLDPTWSVRLHYNTSRCIIIRHNPPVIYFVCRLLPRLRVLDVTSENLTMDDEIPSCSTKTHSQLILDLSFVKKGGAESRCAFRNSKGFVWWSLAEYFETSNWLWQGGCCARWLQ